MSTKPDPVAEPAPATEFALKYPFTSAAGVRIERISLRRARRADMRAAHKFSQEEFEQDTFLLARLAGLTMDDIDALDLEDNNELVERFRGMLGRSAAQPGDPVAGG